MILNLIAENKHDQNLTLRILNSSEVPSENNFEGNSIAGIENQMEALDFTEPSMSEGKSAEKSNNTFKFKMQDLEHIERGVHCTKGI